MPLSYLSLISVPAVIGVCLWLQARVWRLRRSLLACAAARDTAVEAERAGVRLLRLAAHDLRGLGLMLQGHAQADGGSGVGPVGAAAAQILDIADDMQDQATPALAARTLREETLDLRVALDDAIAATAAALAPGQRHWRVAPATADAMLWADRRALRHVLGRVLAEAARSSRHADWIDIAILPHPEGLVLTVRDEGAGLATPEAAPAGGPVDRPGDSRGIGLRLTLARSLMAAHGGRLEVQAQASIGSQVSLVFPAFRIRPNSLRIPSHPAEFPA